MKQKRLNHAAQNICQIFCGWRLDPSAQRLAELGSGVLEIDVLAGQCSFNGSRIESLPIVNEIRAWFLDDLDKSGIPVLSIHSVSLRAELFLSRVPWNPGNEKFFKDGGEVVTSEMNRCEMDCTGVITTNEKQYRGTYHAAKKWPINWSAA